MLAFTPNIKKILEIGYNDEVYGVSKNCNNLIVYMQNLRVKSLHRMPLNQVLSNADSMFEKMMRVKKTSRKILQF